MKATNILIGGSTTPENGSAITETAPQPSTRRAGLNNLTSEEFSSRLPRCQARNSSSQDRFSVNVSLRSDVKRAYHGSDAALTRRVLKCLESCGWHGKIAATLFRIQKSSERAKCYRGEYKGLAYDNKDSHLERLCGLLENQTAIHWGWGRDNAAEHGPRNVIYVDLPNGQVSFHNFHRHGKRAYGKPWDGTYLSVDRILEFCSLIQPTYDDTLTALGYRWYLEEIVEASKSARNYEFLYERYADLVRAEEERQHKMVQLRHRLTQEKAKSQPNSKLIRKWTERMDALLAA